MGDIYELIIDERLFKRISGKKFTYLVFINDKDKQQYKEENILSLKSSDEGATTTKLRAKINKLLYFPTIKELVQMLGKEKCGFRESASVDNIEDSFHKKYKSTVIKKYGYVAIGVELQED